MAVSKELERLGQIAKDVVWDVPLYSTHALGDAEKTITLRAANDRIIARALMRQVEAAGGMILPAKTANVRRRSQADGVQWKVELYDAGFGGYRWSVGAATHGEAMRMANAWVNGNWDGGEWMEIGVVDVED